jgi:uncharacterized HAD superfamily protein
MMEIPEAKNEQRRRMVIAVDYDDVVVDSASKIIAHYNATYGAHVTLENLYAGNYTGDWNAPDADTAISRVNSYLGSREYIDSAPDREAVRVLGRLAIGHELHVISGRSQILEEATREMIDRHFSGIFSSVELTNFIATSGSPAKRGKGEACQEIGADVLIDDHLGHAEDVASKGIKVLLFGDYPWNVADNLPANIERCRGWAEVEKYFYGDNINSIEK